MNRGHLSDDELDRALAGERLESERDEHVKTCIPCRRRRDLFVAAVERARVADPDREGRDRVRTAALDRWGEERPLHRRLRWWLAVAAVLVLVALLTVAHGPTDPPAGMNVDAVLADVDDVLSRDPLTAMAPEDVLAVVVPESTTGATEGPS